MTKISTFSDQPFSFPPWNRIFGAKIMKFLIPGQNFGIFASPTKGMGTFLFEMSMKWMFTFKNFRNVYWHGKTHSAMMIRYKDKHLNDKMLCFFILLSTRSTKTSVPPQLYLFIWNNDNEETHNIEKIYCWSIIVWRATTAVFPLRPR